MKNKRFMTYEKNIASKKPWINNQNYLKDIFEINYGKIEDNSLRFS